jgi:hypothetical protein
MLPPRFENFSMTAENTKGKPDRVESYENVNGELRRGGASLIKNIPLPLIEGKGIKGIGLPKKDIYEILHSHNRRCLRLAVTRT